MIPIGFNNLTGGGGGGGTFIVHLEASNLTRAGHCNSIDDGQTNYLSARMKL